MENNIYINQIYRLYDALRNAFFSKNIGFSVIRLLFLKYASDNCLGATTVPEMQNYMRVQRMLSAGDVGLGPNGLVPVLDMLDEHYHLDHLMHNSINEYAKELFGLDDSWVKKNTSDKNFVEIMSILSSMDLTDDPETHEKGRQLALSLIDNLQYHGENARLASPFYSRRELGPIINKILNVQDDDIFLDFCSGIGTTTISAVESRRCKIINQDISEECLSVAAMLYMMCGYEEFELQIQDRFPMEYREVENIEEEFEVANKIFVEPPVALRVRNHPLRDSSLISLGTAAALLKENGTAIVVVSATALTTQFIGSVKLREELVGNGYVQSVIALPLTFTRTSIPMYMVVLSKKKNDGVLFVNFTSYANKANKYKGANVMTEEHMDLLSRIVCNCEEIESVSRKVSLNEIVKKEYDLMPMVYVTEVKTTPSVSIEEIDRELDELYSQLLLRKKKRG
jgi:hypothetical protein